MPRLPVYVACAAGAAGIGYVGYHWVYEPLSTVQQHAEDTLQATMFYHQRFLQRAQMLAREITEGKTDKMLSLYSRCMIVREEAMAEDMLQHEALSRILDEVVRQRCLPLDFREEALSRLQAYTAAVTYVAYILYFKIFVGFLDWCQLGTQSHLVGWFRRSTDACVARTLLAAVQAPVEVDDWREIDTASDEETLLRNEMRLMQKKRDEAEKYVEVDKQLAEAEQAAREAKEASSILGGKKGSLIDRAEEKKEEVELTDSQKAEKDAMEREARRNQELIKVEMSYEEKIDVLHRLRQSTRGLVTPTRLYVAHTSHWLEELAARAAFPTLVDRAAKLQTVSRLPPPVLAVLRKRPPQELTQQRRSLLERFQTEAARALQSTQGKPRIGRGRFADDDDESARTVAIELETVMGMTEAALREDEIIEAAERARQLTEYSRNNATDFPAAARHMVDRVFRFGYPWAASAEGLRMLFDRFGTPHATPLAFYGVHRFVRTQTEGVYQQRREEAERRGRQASGAEASVGRRVVPQTNLPDAPVISSVPEESVAVRRERRGRLVEKMRLEDEEAEASELNKQQAEVTGARPDYSALTGAVAEARPAATVKQAASFGDVSHGAQSTAFDTPRTQLQEQEKQQQGASPTNSPRVPLAAALRQTIKDESVAGNEKRDAEPASDEPVDDTAAWNVYGGTAKGGKRARRVMRVMAADPVTPEEVWATTLKLVERQHEARHADAAYRPTALGA
jgi:hypothetical protein